MRLSEGQRVEEDCLDVEEDCSNETKVAGKWLKFRGDDAIDCASASTNCHKVAYIIPQMIGNRGRGQVDNGAVSDQILYLPVRRRNHTRQGKRVDFVV